MNTNANAVATHTTFDLRADQFDHADWNQAPPIQITHYWSGVKAPASRWAEARILWSNKALIVRFKCAQEEPLVLSSNPQTLKKTIGLWDRDVCEIFLAPNPAEPKRYFEFEVAPTGEWIDLAIAWKHDERQTDWTFASGMTGAAEIKTDHVTVGMRIPWTNSLKRPQRGDRWRMNLFRCVGSDPNRGYLAWQPTRTPKPNFHVPEAFGWLAFSE